MVSILEENLLRPKIGNKEPKGLNGGEISKHMGKSKAGKWKILKVGLYFPDFSHSNSDFAFQVLKGDKKANNYMNF